MGDERGRPRRGACSVRGGRWPGGRRFLLACGWVGHLSRRDNHLAVSLGVKVGRLGAELGQRFHQPPRLGFPKRRVAPPGMMPGSACTRRRRCCQDVCQIALNVADDVVNAARALLSEQVGIVDDDEHECLCSIHLGDVGRACQ